MTKTFIKFFALIFAICMFAIFANAQTANLNKRTTYKNEKLDFGAGGTLTILGAPNGLISIEGTNKNEIEISADIEVQAENEADLAELSKISGFILDESTGHIRVISVGTHDKDYMKRVAKKFPKRLLNLPLKIDYRIKVPAYCDLQINSGKGDLTISTVEGTFQINALESNATLNLIGGTIDATFGSGNVDVKIGTRSWRGRHVNFQLASGNLSAQFPANMSADIDASVLRNGKVENSFISLKPRERSKFSEKQILARAGNGGAQFSFTVGDGTIKIQN